MTPHLARSNVLVVTGTDTGVGKTWVACALARALVRAGRRVIALKLIETGYDDAPGGAEDGALLARATGQAEPTAALVRLAAPLAPAPAADREGLTLDFDEMLLRVEGYAANADVVLVEGSGGLLAPMGWDWNLVDLAQALEARALLVGADRLGTISHALLTLSALEIGGVPLAGLVLTAPARPDGSTGTNAAAIERLSGVSGIIVTPRTADNALASAAFTELAARLAGGAGTVS